MRYVDYVYERKRSQKFTDIARHMLSLVIISFVAIFTCRHVIFSSQYIGGMDTWGPLSTIGYFSRDNRALNIWNTVNPGSVTPIILYHFLALINSVVNDPQLVMKLFFCSLIALGGLFIYHYAYYLTKNIFVGLISAIIFILNRWLAAKLAVGHFLHVASYCIIPILFYALDKYFKENKFIFLIIFSFLHSLLIIFRFDPAFYITPFLILRVIFIVFTDRKELKTSILMVVKMAFVGGILFLLLSFCSWFPLVITGTEHSTRVYSQGLQPAFALKLLPTILGHARELSYDFYVGHTDWNTHPFLSLPLHYLVMLAIPLLAFLAVVLKKEDKEVWFFTLMALITVFMAKGPHPPLGEVHFLNPWWPLFHSSNRFLMDLWFCYALLTGISLNQIYVYLNKNAKGILAFSIILLLPLISLFLGNYYILRYGYQVWQPPAQEIAPHLWLREHAQEGRVVTVPYSYTYMFNQQGWMDRDVGSVSYMYSDRSIFNRLPIFKNYLQTFDDYVKILIRRNETHRLPKILGAYDVKYVVLQGYPVTVPDPILHVFGREYEQHDFFERQKGLQLVYEGAQTDYELKIGENWVGVLAPRLEPPQLRSLPVTRAPKIYENKEWLPRIYAPRKVMLVLGGLETFLKLAERDDFEFGDWNLLFADRLREQGEDLLKIMAKADAWLFVNSEMTDLAMMLTKPVCVRLNRGGDEEDTGWEVDPEAEMAAQGWFVYGRQVIHTRRKGDYIQVPLTLEGSESQRFELWVRAFWGPNVGHLALEVDGEEVGHVAFTAPEEVGFKWAKVTELSLSPGQHLVGLRNLGSAPNGEHNWVDEIWLLEPGAREEALLSLSQIVEEKSLLVLSLVDEDKRTYFENNDPEIARATATPNEMVEIFEADEPDKAEIVSFERLSNSKYKVQVKAQAPYTIVFSDSYHPLWRALVEGKEIKSIPANYFANSFFVDKAGEYEMIIEFMGQRYQNAGLVVSGLTNVLAGAFVIGAAFKALTFKKAGSH